MEKKLEIFENTLLKILIRRGSDVDRRGVVLSEGELGYTTDTKKLFVGDGQTPGGILVGGGRSMSYLGAVADVTTFTAATTGEIAYDYDNKNLYVLENAAPTTITSWRKIGGVYSSDNTTIKLNNTNTFYVGTISANNLDKGIIDKNLTFTSSNKITLSSAISINRIKTDTVEYIDVPQKFKINNVEYSWPGGVANNLFLGTDISGQLVWKDPTNYTSFVAGTASQIPVGSIMPFVSSSAAPPNWLLCNGQSVAGASYKELSAVIGTTYGGNTTQFNLPDFRNKTLYGVNALPGSSTLFSIASGSNINAGLSAVGALFIIKAKPDQVVNATITVNNPLTAALNGTSITDVKTNLFQGDLNIGIPRSALSSDTLDMIEVLNYIYPVGTILHTFDSVNPGTRSNPLPGTWSQVAQGRFIVGVGTGTDSNTSPIAKTFSVGNNAGKYSHKLTIAEMPGHAHNYTLIDDDNINYQFGNIGNDGWRRSESTSSVGGDQYHENTVPGYGLYVWRRTA